MSLDLMVLILDITYLKNGAYVIQLDKYADVGTHWMALYVSDNKVIYFDSFRDKHVPKEIMHFIGDKNIKAKIFRIQGENLKMCGFFSIKFIDFMLANKILIDCTSLFSPYDFERIDDRILSYLK